MKIAISGKGGVGKTTIMALVARAFREQGREVLVIDADPSPHMAQTLGMQKAGSITPLAEMRHLLAERAEKTQGSPFYQLNPRVDDLLRDYLLEEQGYKLMVLGAIQSADSGCACPENHVLRKMLKKMLLTAKQVVLLDMEAGVEHLGRGTVAGVDHLLIVVIPSRSSVRTAQKIEKLAREVRIPHIWFVGNLIQNTEDEDFLRRELGAEPIAFFPDSVAIRKAERNGNPIVGITEDLQQAPEQIVSTLLGSVV